MKLRKGNVLSEICMIHVGIRMNVLTGEFEGISGRLPSIASVKWTLTASCSSSVHEQEVWASTSPPPTSVSYSTQTGTRKTTCRWTRSIFYVQYNWHSLPLKTSIPNIKKKKTWILHLWTFKSWIPQAQARCHRIGQSKAVKVYRLITRNSYEREMFDKASLKLGLDKAVLQDINRKGSLNGVRDKQLLTFSSSDELRKRICQRWHPSLSSWLTMCYVLVYAGTCYID